MHKLWTRITEIAGSTGSIPSGDTACGFANTAMVLADRGFIPKVFSAVIRVVSSVRSLAAVEAGAVGPHKDCGYEGVYVKAITGIPISMEWQVQRVRAFELNRQYRRMCRGFVEQRIRSEHKAFGRNGAYRLHGAAYLRPPDEHREEKSKANDLRLAMPNPTARSTRRHMC